MDSLPVNVNRLIEEFAKLPTIGPKTAERLTFYLLKSRDEQALAEAIANLKNGLERCAMCRNYADQSVCAICLDPRRDGNVIAVVSQPLDVVALERTGQFRGRYHVLHGIISPIDGIGPEQLEIDSLLRRLERDHPDEIILATNPNLEGETTALYLVKHLEPFGIKTTRLAHGLPVGGDLEYADQVTLARALDNRQSF